MYLHFYISFHTSSRFCHKKRVTNLADLFKLTFDPRKHLRLTFVYAIIDAIEFAVSSSIRLFHYSFEVGCKPDRRFRFAIYISGKYFEAISIRSLRLRSLLLNSHDEIHPRVGGDREEIFRHSAVYSLTDRVRVRDITIPVPRLTIA